MEILEVTVAGTSGVMLAGMQEVMAVVMGRTSEVVNAAGLLMVSSVIEAGDVTANIFPIIVIVAVIITTTILRSR